MGAKSGRNKRAAKGSGKGGSAKRGGSKGGDNSAQRLGLLLFGVAFVAIFVIFAVAQGLGSSSVPSGDAAVVSSVPNGTLSEAEVKRGTGQQIAAKISSGEFKKAPKPGSKKYEEVRSAAIGEALLTVWIGGEAEELRISPTGKQVAAELAEVKKQNFKTEAAYKKFLKETHLSRADVIKRVKLQLLSKEIETKVKGETSPATAAEIKAYYEENKAAQYTTKPTRDVRVIVNEDKAKVEAALKALEADNSPANWKKVAEKYSSEPTTAKTGGLQKGISEELLKGAIKKAIFGSATGEVVGPTAYEKNFLLTEVVALHPQKVQTLAEVKSTISTQLTETKQQEFFSTFVSDFESKWTGRTQCAADFETERCANFPASKLLEKQREPYKTCYEANPKTPATECPAAVQLNTPALPGSVTVLKPQGERLVQRARPESGAAGAAATESAGAASAEGATGSATEAEAAEAEAAAAAAAAEAEAEGSSGE